MNLSILLGVIGPWQIVIIAVIILLLFGGKKIPELMKGVGRGIKEFKEIEETIAANTFGKIKHQVK